MGPADEGEVEGGKPSKGKEKKAKGKEQEMGQEKPEVKAPPKGRKPVKENIKWVSVTGDARCGRCVSMNLCCLRPAHGSTSNGIAVTACKVCKEKKSKCMWGVEGETDNNIAAAAADDDDEEVALSPLADKASGSWRGTVKGLNPTGRPRTHSQSRAWEESPEPLEVDDTDFQLGLQQQLATQKTQPIVKPPNRQPETKRQVPRVQGPPNRAPEVVSGITIQRRPAVSVPVGADSDLTHEHPYDSVGLLSKRIAEREQAGREDAARLDALIHQLTQHPILTRDDYERINGELADLQKRWLDNSTRVLDLKAQVRPLPLLEDRIKEVEKEMKRQTNIVNKFQFTMGTAVDPIVFEVMKEDIDEMKEKAGRIREDVKGIKEGTGKMRQDVVSVQQGLSTIRSNVSRVEGDLADLWRLQEAMQNEKEAALRISDGDVQALHKRVNELLKRQSEASNTTSNLTAQQQRSILEILEQIEEIRGDPEPASTQGSNTSTIGDRTSLFSITGRLRDLENNTLEALKEVSTERRQETGEMERKIGETLQGILDKLKVLPEVMSAMKGITEKLATLETQVNNVSFSVYTHDAMYSGSGIAGPSGPPSPATRPEPDDSPPASKGLSNVPLQHPTSNTRTPLATNLLQTARFFLFTLFSVTTCQCVPYFNQ
ncbi:hypothetical protein FA13DRAFT_1797513 [Coprinellus micaceus]|uniref:Uncharacterized protein n=1 Tax=Coprinellus micaceus TaxID=71717 RepID=A0A4Y7SSA9_COPMI|nr:hypothetical protein FA13DRAFT_1797513 [Coprinellus micaceus]